jgi:hypothetical protein
MGRFSHFASKVFTGAAVTLMLAGLIVLAAPNKALADSEPIRQKCTDDSCGTCTKTDTGFCNNADGEDKGSCGSTGTGCAGCTCGYVSSLAPCACSK